MSFLTNTVARVVYAVPFAIFGLLHVAYADKMGGMVPSWVPGGVIWVYVTGIAMVAAGAAIAMKVRARQACFGLAALLFIFILTIHGPGLANSAMRDASMAQLLKDMALMGAALFLAGRMD
ncbi:MAG: DoxX family protein [Spirochaetia bacterium]|nr:DoxX family protein [Spirochaetia bacterium]